MNGAKNFFFENMGNVEDEWIDFFLKRSSCIGWFFFCNSLSLPDNHTNQSEP